MSYMEDRNKRQTDNVHIQGRVDLTSLAMCAALLEDKGLHSRNKSELLRDAIDMLSMVAEGLGYARPEFAKARHYLFSHGYSWGEGSRGFKDIYKRSATLSQDQSRMESVVRGLSVKGGEMLQKGGDDMEQLQRDAVIGALENGYPLGKFEGMFPDLEREYGYRKVGENKVTGSSKSTPSRLLDKDEDIAPLIPSNAPIAHGVDDSDDDADDDE